MPIVIGGKRESDFTDPIGLLGDCHRRIVRFLHVLVALATERKGGPLSDEEESLFPRLRRLDSPDIDEVLARIDSLEQDHECADRSHAEVDLLGTLWLTDGRLSPEDASRLERLVGQLDTLYRHHIGQEDTEVFPFAARSLTQDDRDAIGREMATRRGLGSALVPGPVAGASKPR